LNEKAAEQLNAGTKKVDSDIENVTGVETIKKVGAVWKTKFMFFAMNLCFSA
jgi:hypothetical protein